VHTEIGAASFDRSEEKKKKTNKVRENETIRTRKEKEMGK
jgi:hypothetical protein